MIDDAEHDLFHRVSAALDENGVRPASLCSDKGEVIMGIGRSEDANEHGIFAPQAVTVIVPRNSRFDVADIAQGIQAMQSVFDKVSLRDRV